MGKNIGDVIREAREAVGLNQGELAEKLGMAQSQLSDWERGAVVPELRSLKRIAPVLNVDVSVFVDVLIGS